MIYNNAVFCVCLLSCYLEVSIAMKQSLCFHPALLPPQCQSLILLLLVPCNYCHCCLSKSSGQSRVWLDAACSGVCTVHCGSVNMAEKICNELGQSAQMWGVALPY